MMASAGGTFAAIGGIYAGVACASEGVRGKADFWNGVVGGLAAGQVIGVRGRSLGLGVGAGACFAVASAAADAAGTRCAAKVGSTMAPPPRASTSRTKTEKRGGERERDSERGERSRTPG